jgi:hypothetical protein
LFDERDPEQTARVLEASVEILGRMHCLRRHASRGVTASEFEKISFMRKLFTESDIDAMFAPAACL